MSENLVLIGFSGTGKSTVGRLLSTRLGWPLVDTDELLVRRFGKPIAAIFRDDGEAVFRAAEREVVAEVCAASRHVLSLGGGAPTDPANQARLRDGNWIVRLDATPETILHRLTTSPGAEERPMLAGADPLARIRALLAARADAYAIADTVVTTEGRSVEEVAARILDCLPEWWRG